MKFEEVLGNDKKKKYPDNLFKMHLNASHLVIFHFIIFFFSFFFFGNVFLKTLQPITITHSDRILTKFTRHFVFMFIVVSINGI